MRATLADLMPRLRRLATAADSDADLLDRFVKGRDEEAFASLLRRHGPMVLGVAGRLLGDRHAAEDVHQATFLVLARRAAAIRRRESLAAWLYGVARRLAHQARNRRPFPRESCGLERPDPRPGPVDELTTREALVILDEELQRLPEGQRLAVALCCLEGLSQEEAAGRLGWAAGEVKGRLERGRNRLRQRLARRGLSPSAVFALAAIPRLEQSCAVGPLAAAILSGSALRPQARLLATTFLTGGRVKALHAILLLSVGVLTAAGGLLARSQSGAAKQERAEPPASRGPALDLFGDPLPEGAVARMGSTRLRHFGVFDHVWLPDSKTVLSSGYDRVLRYWDATTGKEKRNVPLLGKAGPGRGITLSPDGKTVAAIDGEKLVFWEVESGKEVKTLPGPGARWTFLYFSPDGNTLAVGRDDKRMTLWDWRAGKQREVRLAYQEGAIRHFLSDSTTHGSVSPDGKWFVTAVNSQEPLGVFEVATGREAYRIDCRARISAVSPDSKTLVVCSGKNDKGGRETVFRFFDLATGSPLRQFGLDNEHAYYFLTFSPDGKRLACGRSDNSFVMDCSSGRVLFRLPDKPLAVSFSPDGKTLAASTGLRLRFWDAATGKERNELPEGFGSTPVAAVSPDGRLLAAGDWLDHSVSLWDTSTGRLQRRLPMKGKGRYVRNMAFLDEGKTLLACQSAGFLQFWDVATGKEARTLQLTDPDHPNKDLEHVIDKVYFNDLHPSAGGKRLSTLEAIYGPTAESTRAASWDLATGKLLHSQAFPGKVRRAAWSGDGAAVALPLDKELTMQDIATGAVRFRLPGEVRHGPVTSPDGRLLAVIGAKGTVSLIEAASGKLIVTMDCHSSHHLALAPDGRTLVTADGGSLRAWDLATAKERRRWALPQAGLVRDDTSFTRALLLSPDARRAFTVLADGTALVWDISAALRSCEPLADAPGDKELAALWADLASAEARRAGPTRPSGDSLSPPARRPTSASTSGRWLRKR